MKSARHLAEAATIRAIATTTFGPVADWTVSNSQVSERPLGRKRRRAVCCMRRTDFAGVASRAAFRTPCIQDASGTYDPNQQTMNPGKDEENHRENSSWFPGFEINL
jgi:hypothetical protein